MTPQKDICAMVAIWLPNTYHVYMEKSLHLFRNKQHLAI